MNTGLPASFSDNSCHKANYSSNMIKFCLWCLSTVVVPHPISDFITFHWFFLLSLQLQNVIACSQNCILWIMRSFLQIFRTNDTLNALFLICVLYWVSGAWLVSCTVITCHWLLRDPNECKKCMNIPKFLPNYVTDHCPSSNEEA